jgi:nitrite reductase/ring-hydroxylating ferredoxin subunit
MLNISRRRILQTAIAITPGFLLAKMDTAQAFSLKEATSTLGSLVDKSSAIKVGKTHIYSGQSATGQQIEVVITRTKRGLFALNGACTHQGCGVSLQGTQLVCPCHRSAFKADTGAVVNGPNGAPANSIAPLTKFKVTESKGNIYIK